jgi:hypothetical protein
MRAWRKPRQRVRNKVARLSHPVVAGGIIAGVEHPLNVQPAFGPLLSLVEITNPA